MRGESESEDKGEGSNGAYWKSGRCELSERGRYRHALAGPPRGPRCLGSVGLVLSLSGVRGGEGRGGGTMRELGGVCVEEEGEGSRGDEGG